MAGKVLKLEGVIQPDGIGQSIANNYVTWNMLRASVVNDWAETRSYIYATDTTKTTNSKLPWKNKTTTPKLTQIRENLYANYYATMFGNRNWISWEAGDEDSDRQEKRQMIEDYMYWVVDQPEFYKEIQKLLLDYVDTGNPFAMAGWLDQTIEEKGNAKIKRGYRGPVPVRISPLSIVFNPIAPSFESAPKIVQTILTLGELKDMVERQSAYPDQVINSKAIFEYLRKYREYASNATIGGGDLSEKDRYLQVDGFTSYRSYLESDYVEVLTFYGDAYDKENDKLYKNHIITVVDRHKVISNIPNPSMFGTAGIHHCGWRPRQDNLWAQGPLDNLVGMQYRIDHVENLKADCFDLMAFPPIEVKGYVSDFTWQPMEKIYVGDEGSVKPFPPDVRILQANSEIDTLMSRMEEAAGAPKEAAGFRNPGEKTKYEVQRMENAYSRIFQSKVAQFEQFLLEPLLNDMLALAVQNMGSSTVPSFDESYKVTSFSEITAEDLAGIGRIKAIGARHFALEAEVVQNLNQMFNSPLGADPAVMQHWSTIALSQMLEKMFKIEKYKIVKPYVRLAEMADSQKKSNSLQEQVAMEGTTPSGMSLDDVG